MSDPTRFRARLAGLEARVEAASLDAPLIDQQMIDIELTIRRNNERATTTTCEGDTVKRCSL